MIQPAGLNYRSNNSNLYNVQNLPLAKKGAHAMPSLLEFIQNLDFRFGIKTDR